KNKKSAQVLDAFGPERVEHTQCALARLQREGLPGAQRPRLLHREVKAWTALLQHQASRLWQSEPSGQLVTRLARRGDTQHCVGEMQPIADPHIRFQQPGYGEIFTQATRWQ